MIAAALGSRDVRDPYISGINIAGESVTANVSNDKYRMYFTFNKDSAVIGGYYGYYGRSVRSLTMNFPYFSNISP